MSKYEYQFITIHTLIDIGDGCTPLFDSDGNLTCTANLSRIVDTVMRYSHPKMSTVCSFNVDLSKQKNKLYYSLGSWEGFHTVYTYKFAIETENLIGKELKEDLNNVPVRVLKNSLSRFITTGTNKNTSIIQCTIS